MVIITRKERRGFVRLGRHSDNSIIINWTPWKQRLRSMHGLIYDGYFDNFLIKRVKVIIINLNLLFREDM